MLEPPLNTSNRISWLISKRDAILLCIAFVLVAYLPFVIGWQRSWYKADSPDSYQPLVPLGAAMLVWIRREQIAAIYRDTLPYTKRTIFFALAGCLLMIVAHITRGWQVSMLAFLVLTIGTVLYLWGSEVLKAAAVPLLFLCLIFPHPFRHAMTQTLQINSTQASGNVLEAVGVKNTVEGNDIILDKYRVEVTRACSGVGILLPLVLMSIWLLGMMQSSGTQKTFLLASAIIIALAVNVLRIVSMGLIGRFNPALADKLHDANSWIFTLLAFALTFGVSRLIGIRKPWEPNYASYSEPDPEETAPYAATLRKAVFRLSLLLLLTATLGFVCDKRIGAAGGWLPPIPAKQGIWISQEEKVDWTMMDSSKYLSRTYLNPFGEMVQIFVVAPESADVYTDPRGCLRGGAYDTTGQKEVTLDKPGSEVRAMVLRHPHRSLIMYHWIQDRVGKINPEAAIHGKGNPRTQLVKQLTESVLSGRQRCLIRVYAAIEENDPMGKQARRNVHEISRLVHRALLEGR
jgi:exosortase